MKANRDDQDRLGTLAQLASILDCLSGAGLRFCSWKSNLHLSAGLAGTTDIDLLVDPKQVDRFAALLQENGCLKLSPPPNGDQPGMSHYLGMDPATERLFHLHVHDRLVLGQRYTKNHVLPLTGQFLANSSSDSGLPVVDPALELVVLTARALLKYRSRDFVKDLLKIRSPGLPEETRAEVAWCIASTSESQRKTMFALCEAVIPTEIVLAFSRIVQGSPRSAWQISVLRRRLESALKPFRRRNRIHAFFVYSKALLSRKARWRFDPRLRSSPPASIIAFIGADGSGKTTISTEITAWLGEKLSVRHYYMGSKQPSRPTRWSYMVFRVFRRSHRDLSRRTGGRDVTARALAWARDVWLAAHHLAVAGDRLGRLKRLRIDASKGRVVLLDRYPMESLSQSPRQRLLDGPSIQPSGSWTMKALANLEVRLYQRFEPPDGLVFLTVDPVVALSRKPDHDPRAVAEKAMATEDLLTMTNSTGLKARSFGIDANQPWPQPLRTAKDIVWQIMLSHGQQEQ